MSTIYNGDHNIDLKVHFLKVNKNKSADAGQEIYNEEGSFNKKVVEIIEIEPQAILNLSYEESSLSLGVNGSILVDNTFNILEAIDLNNTTQYDIYIHLHVKDGDLTLVNGIDALCYVTNLANASAGYINNNVTFNFEEAFVNALRSISLERLINDFTLGSIGIDTLAKAGITRDKDRFTTRQVSVLDVLNFANNVRYFPAYNPTVKNIIHPDSATSNTLHYIFAPANKDKDSNLYDVVMSMLDESLAGSIYEDHGSNNHQCPYLRMAYDPKDDTRKMLFAPYITDEHKRFLTVTGDNNVYAKVVSSKNKSDRDFSKVYTEKFAFGPLASIVAYDPNASLGNIVETYNLNRANINSLKGNVWGNYKINDNAARGADPGIVRTKTSSFRSIQQQYIIREYGNANVSVNLPILNADSLKTFTLDLNYVCSPLGENAQKSRPGLEPSTHAYNKAYNMVVRSFLTIAETITFDCGGQTYRQPNKFIWVEKFDGKEGDVIHDKLYYVNRVAHRFEGSDYSTEIQASKWSGNTSEDDIFELGSEDQFENRVKSADELRNAIQQFSS